MGFHGDFVYWMLREWNSFHKLAGWFISLENPNQNWMTTRGTPISGSHHFCSFNLYHLEPILSIKTSDSNRNDSVHFFTANVGLSTIGQPINIGQPLAEEVLGVLIQS